MSFMARRGGRVGRHGPGYRTGGAAGGQVTSHGSGILGGKMDAATLNRAPLQRTRPRPAARPRAWRDSRVRGRRVELHARCSGIVLLVTLGLRLWGIQQGLPYSYNVDEATHFVPRAIAFFSHDLNPQYFLNPPAYSYLLHIVFELWFGSGDAVARAFANDPTRVYVVARVVAAVLGTVSVWLTYLAGERLFGRTAGVAGRGDLRLRLPAGLLQPSGPQRRTHPGPGRPLAVRGLGRAAPRLAPRLRDRRGRDRAGRRDEVHRRVHRLACSLPRPADGGGRSGARRAAPDRPGSARRAGRLRDRQSVRGARLLGLPGRHLDPGFAGRRRRSRASSGRRRAAAPPTTCGRSPGGWAGRRRWPRSAARSCCSSAGG